MSPLDTLKQDVQLIYSTVDKTTQTYQKDYDFEGNKVTIIFNRVWQGEAYKCGIDMYGSAVVKMQTKNSELEEKIEKIIKIPSYATMAGTFPVVDKINFN